ncbi:unnamed protein product [Peniophora sp. CBMAI 1063]|nr:unnamed protein product [Peniophora sp. CBMAI 1063]
MTNRPLYPIVQKLVDWLDKAGNEDVKGGMATAFVWVATNVDWGSIPPPGIAPESDSDDSSGLSQYIKILNDFVHWVPVEDKDGRTVYSFLCLFYLLLDHEAVVKYQAPIKPGEIAPWLWLSQWVIQYAKEVGKWMDTPMSLTEKSLQKFKDSPPYNVGAYDEPDGGWETFNDFFARKFKDYPTQRPIASPSVDTVIVNPADSAFDGDWEVTGSGMDAGVTFDVKGLHWTTNQLLDDLYDGDGNAVGPQFAGGRFTHSFLGPTDYHRMHAPVSGKVVAAKVIPGLCHLEAVLKPKDPEADPKKPGAKPFELFMHRYMRRVDDKSIPKEHRGIAPSAASVETFGTGMVPDAPNSPGYQFLQARGLVLIDTEGFGNFGLVAVLPIGMAQVSSVVLSVKKGQELKKGDEIAYFQLGGSDIVMVFQDKANVVFDQVPINTHRNFGEKVAVARPGKAPAASK